MDTILIIAGVWLLLSPIVCGIICAAICRGKRQAVTLDIIGTIGTIDDETLARIVKRTKYESERLSA